MPGCVQPIARQEIVRGNGVCKVTYIRKVLF